MNNFTNITKNFETRIYNLIYWLNMTTADLDFKVRDD